ncbi:DinB family protein [Mucilaginibacter aquatilis]|uniref:DUF664 domain-containing protein n=1 Tax=Mucilaginibacter aquatilis TaxID=1517760 RepID=A0A6I4I7Q8_9SPHI|nr:DinB family protein [Mucilaginibacter aquatilis]MVN90937.1 DUF664 domain-containing protein [Mucilaginibacter aquatilis]
MITQPQPSEYAPFYAGYVNAAIAGGDIIQTLIRLKYSTYKLFTSVDEQKGNYAYAPGKWTIKQLLNHMVDAERIFAFRLLCFMRGDSTALPGFDENAYVEQSDVSNRTLQSIAAEFKAVREANIYLFESVKDDQLAFTGVANGQPVSIRALLYIMAGHEMHHINIIKQR